MEQNYVTVTLEGNMVSFHNTIVTDATIILYVYPSFPACGFVLVGFKK